MRNTHGALFGEPLPILPPLKQKENFYIIMYQ